MEHFESDLPASQAPKLLHAVIDNTLDDLDSGAFCNSDRRKQNITLYQDGPIEPSSELPPPAAINVCSRQKAVLLIGNDRSVLQNYERLLRHNGFVVRRAQDGREGLRLQADCGPFCVIIIDCRLHNWSEVVTTIRLRDSLQRMLIGAMEWLDEGEESISRSTDIDGIPAAINKEDLTRALGKLEFWATKAEVDQAYRALTPAQLRILQKAADFRARTFGRAARGRDGSDLLREAVLKAFIGNDTGGRRWYRSVDFFWFLFRAITSVADNWKKRGALELQTYSACEALTRGPEGQETSPLESIPSRDPAAEQRLLAKAEVEWIFRTFEHDREATLVLTSWSQGMKKEEIIKDCGLTRIEYNAAAKRIRTQLKTKNGGGTNDK